MKLVAIALVSLLATGCATIVGSTTHTVGLSSSPPGAKVVVRDEAGKDVFNGVTPASITLKKHKGYFSGHTYTFSFTKAGYDEHIELLSAEASDWYVWGNLLIGGLIGWVLVDPATGAMWTYDQENLNVALTKSGAAHAAPLQP